MTRPASSQRQAVRTRSSPPQSSVRASGLVGREAEITALTGALTHSPALVLVEGEAGIGKTRLLREFLGSDQQDQRTLVAVCPPIRQPQTHWADEATLEFLLYLASRQPQPLSLVVTYRPEDVSVGSLLPRLSPGTTGCGSRSARWMWRVRPSSCRRCWPGDTSRPGSPRFFTSALRACR